MAPTSLLPIVRYVFYAFIFTFPLESLDVGLEPGVFSISSLMGYLFITVALLQPAVAFGELPRPLWYFAGYLFVVVAPGIWQILGGSSGGGLMGRLSSSIQMVVLFWISYNLFQHERVVKEAMLSLSLGCIVLSGLQIGGIGANAVAGGRVSALSLDANGLGSMLGLGLLALLGLTYGRASQEARIVWPTWVGFGCLAAGIVLSGSRGAFVSLVMGIMCLASRPGHSALRVKIGIATVFALSILILAVYQNDAVRVRWEQTFSEGHMSGRERIMPEAWSMFVEAPVFGWGPGNHTIELGHRFGRGPLDTHNGYLWVLTETGLAGAIPYFIALWFCLRSAWRARYGPEGSLPFALLVCVFLVNMSITWHHRKILWMILAYCMASESFLSKRQSLAHPPGDADKVSRPIAYGPYGT